MNRVEIVVFSPDAKQCESLCALLASCEDITVFHGTGVAATSSCRLDAQFVTGMHLERWGVGPFLRNHAEVRPSPGDKVALGLPDLFVAGWLQADGDEASYGTRYAKLMLGAVDEYNEVHPNQPVRRVGTIPHFLDLQGKYAQANAKALKALLRDRVAHSSMSSPETSRIRVA